MSLASVGLSFVHRCTFQRNTTTGTDDWGAPDVPEWEPDEAETPCRLWTTTGREQIDADSTVAVSDMRMIVPLNADVSPEDRVGDVTSRGATIAVGPIGIRAVIRRKDHLELLLVRLA